MTYLQDITDLSVHRDFAQRYPVYKELLEALEKICIVSRKSFVVPRFDTGKKIFVIDSPPVTKYEIVSWTAGIYRRAARKLKEKMKRAELYFDDRDPAYIRIQDSWDPIEGSKGAVYIYYQEHPLSKLFHRLMHRTRPA